MQVRRSISLLLLLGSVGVFPLSAPLAEQKGAPVSGAESRAVVEAGGRLSRDLEQGLSPAQPSCPGCFSYPLLPTGTPALIRTADSEAVLVSAPTRFGEDVFSGLSVEYIQELFTFLSSLDRIPHYAVRDGCYARAHEMAHTLESLNGIRSGKIFITRPSEKENLWVSSPYAEGYGVKWVYHVALVLYDKSSQPWVIDPSLFERAVPVAEWTRRVTEGTLGRYGELYFTNAYTYSISDKLRMSSFSEIQLKDARARNAKFLPLHNDRKKKKKPNQAKP